MLSAMFKVTFIFTVFLASGVNAQGLNPNLQRLHDEVSGKVRNLGVEAHAKFLALTDQLDSFRINLVKDIVYDAYKNFMRIQIFIEEYVAIVTGEAANTPGKLGEELRSVQSAAAAAAPTPRPCEMKPVEDIMHRSQNSKRILAHCVLKYLKSADKAINQVHTFEREFVHKLYHIELRVKQCATHFTGTPGADHQIDVCLRKAGDDGRQLEKDVLPKVWEHFQLVEDFYHHEETDINHCMKEADMEYYQMSERHELHHKIQICPPR